MAELPQVGERVLVLFEATVKDVNATGQFGLVYVLEDGDVHGTWVHAKAVTVLPPPRPVGPPGAPEPERSPTAIELRLQSLERRCTALDELVSRESFGDRLRKLEEDSYQHSTTLTALLPDRKRIAELERLLGELLRHLREV